MKRVTSPLKLQMKRPEVADLQAALVLLGATIAEAEKTAQRYGASTRTAVTRFQTAQKLPATGEVDEATAIAINGLLAERGVLDPDVPDAPGPDVPGTDVPGPDVPDGPDPVPVPAGRRVVGTVLHVDGSAIDKMMVQAYHRQVGGELPLGVETLTDPRGKYEIGFQLPAGISKIDLFVRAFSEPQDGKPRAIVAVSPIVIGSGLQEVLDLTVSDPKYRGPSEFARATGVLGPAVAGAKLDALTADDVALLVRNTGLSRASVTAWIAARRLAERTKVDHESLYGLVRTENTASLPRLLRHSAKRLLGSLTSAADSNLISHAAGQRAGATVKRLRQLAVTLSAAHDTPGSLGRLLATGTKASPAQQTGFIERYANHEGPVQALWEALRKDPGFGDAVVDDLQLSLQLGTLSANHPPLVKALRASGVQRASQTATLDDEGWQRLLQTEIDGAPVATPPGIKGADAAERRNNYVTLLKERSALAFPTAHVARTLKTLPTWQSSSAVGFLDINPGFNLLKANIRSSLNAPDVVIQPDWDRATLEMELATVQRVSRVAPRGKEEPVVNALLGNGYTSALAISRQSRATFRRKTAAAFGDEAMADTVHRNAQFQVARAGNAYALTHPITGGGYIDAIGGISTEVATDPTWAALFGNVDYCSCEHCRSIHGPAAYFVDLLTWLDGHDAGPKTAFERLNDRRPDIQRIELSCENTNTVVPYVDLVNEILEVRVLNPSGTGSSAPAVPRATTGTSPELLANPEYLNKQAYDEHLAKAVFPVLLPFDLWGELGRVYFEHLGVRRSDLMEALRRQGAPRGDAIDAERLKMSMAQQRILTGVARHEVWDYWGYSSATPGGVNFKVDLAVVSNFRRRADIEYEQLLDLLHSRFVSPVGIRITGAACNTDEMRLVSLTDEVLGRMHRFLRLWRNRGWSMLDLDKALHALNITTLDAAGLGRLADLDRMQALTRAPLLEVLSWWAPIDTLEDRPEKELPVKSLYDRIYLNRAVDATAEELTFPLALNAARTALLNTVTWDDVRSILQAALSIDADALALLLDETVGDLPNEHRVVTGTTATMEGLSALYRHVSLARRLALTVSELLGLLRLVGLDPFDIANTSAAVALIETVDEMRASDFSLLELHYLLEHDALAETSVGVTDEAIGQTLVEVRDGLARVETDYAVAADPAGEITARYLGALLDADAVTAVMTALRTEADGTNQAELEAVLTDHLGVFFSVDAAALIRREVEGRFDALVKRLAPYLQETQGNAVIIEKVAGFAGRDLDSAQDLLSLRLQMTVDGKQVSALAALRQSPYTDTTTPEIALTDDPEAFAALRRIHKAALVLSKLGVAMDAQAWLFDVGVRNGLLNPLALPIVPQAVSPGAWDAWTRLVDLAALNQDLPGGEPSVVELLQLLESTDDPAITEAAFLTELTARTGWLRTDVDTLVAAFSPAFPGGWRDGRTLRTLIEVLALTGRLGASASQADAWATGSIGATQAEELRLAAKSKHDEERWPAIARALRDPVREQQRAALVAYLIAREEKYAGADDLFNDLLIDVAMTPCMLTSRLKQAISTVQLFVQRAFLNLEDGIELTRDDSQQWEWMKNYRVWEAARKVFLYVENWLEPELRLDKSPLFEQLENTLQQGELNDVAAEKAYTQYLEGLQKIARLKVMGLYHQFEEDDDGTVDVLHVVARTRSHPHEYYYRQWIGARDWSPWEKIDADIEADHVILAVHDRRLLLFWPMVAQKAESSTDPHVEPAVSPVTIDYYEMKLAWIERMNGQWGARRLSAEFLKLWDQAWMQYEHIVYFRLGTAGRLSIDCFLRADDTTLLLGTFVVDAGSAEVTVEGGSGNAVELDETQIREDRLPEFEFVSRMRLVGHDSAHVFISSSVYDSDGQIVSGPDDILLLEPTGASVGLIDYAYPHQYAEFMSQHGVFMDDKNRTFHVMPEPGLDFAVLDGTDSVRPSDVGTVMSKSNVFLEEKADPRFESAIPWDIQTATTSQKGVARPVETAGRRGAPRASASAAVASNVAIAGTLTNDGLQQSQSQLFETGQSWDAMTVATTNKYRFSLFYHPYVQDFMAELRRGGIAGLLDPNPDGPAPRLVRQQKSLDFFVAAYSPTSSVLNTPLQDIDFEIGGAYAKYNWEIFFHAPMLIASRLSQNQRFEEARRWFHFVFDPANRTDDEDPLRFWKIKPFYRDADAPIEEFLALAASTEDSAEADAARQKYDQQIEAWVEDPFNPHRIAELRTTAYQKTLVMKYLDNLIAWGDQLFRRDTIESINEATQLYVLALQLLGERPDALPPRSVPVPTTFEAVRGNLAGSVLNNPLVQLENLAAQPVNRAAPSSPVITAANSWGYLLFSGPIVAPPTTPSAPPGFYFCIPPNEKLLGYWDTVEDRLFKIRHCMNIEGVVRQLPLFEPPIDPGMLVRARAAGIDLSSALADLNAPLPYYRFSVMLQKTYALNQTVRGLGGALLSALEKTDAEALAILRANQEVATLEAVRQVKKLAVEEARHSLTAAERSLVVVEQRRDYYLRLTVAGLRPEEVLQTLLMEQARKKQKTGSIAMGIAGAVANIPAMVTGASGIAASPVATATVVSGLAIAKGFELGGQALVIEAASVNAEASMLGITGGFARRKEDWENQLELSRREIKQIEKQIEAARVRVALAERDVENHERQIENSRSVREFMEQKFTNVELCQWMVGQLSTIYFQSYQLAYDLAKRTEHAYRHELALPDATFIQFGYWDSLKKGLLAGERLQFDLERMDAGYLDNNPREYELTRHVSLALVEPVALLQLQTTGTCEFSLPEALFDLDYPGHYMRRIKSVGVTVPCVTGPYTGVPMRLTMVSSRTRVDPSAADRYPMELAADDLRFQVETGAVESIAISNGQQDSGVFAADDRDERYLPFERRGVISDWNLTLTSAVQTFDWSTIADVVIQLRYTAREGGELLREAALASLNAELSDLPLRRAVSAGSEFPTEWNAFLRPAEGSTEAVLSVELAERLFPRIAQDADLKITNLELIALVKEPGKWRSTVITVTTGTDVQAPQLIGSSALYGGQPSASATYAGQAPGTWSVSVPISQLGAPSEWVDDLVLIATYQLELPIN